MAKKAPKAPKKPLGNLSAGWSWFSVRPLKGAGLMREAQVVYAWDDDNNITLLSLYGKAIAQWQAPSEVIAVAAADNGSLIVGVGKSGAVWRLDRELKKTRELSIGSLPIAAAVDPHGGYLVVAGHDGRNLLYAGDATRPRLFESTHPLKHLHFVPELPLLIGGADNGVISGFDIDGRLEWTAPLLSNLGSIAVSGSGSIILLACFTHGLFVHDSEGERVGAYRMEHSPGLVAADYAGESLLVVSLDRHFTKMKVNGQIEGKRTLDEQPIAVAYDALARYGLFAFASGEVRLFLFPEVFAVGPRDSAGEGGAFGRTIVSKWQQKAAANLEEADSAVLAPVPTTDHVALFTNRRTVRIVDSSGADIHETASLDGIGRVLLSESNWLIAATDGRLLAYDPARPASVLCPIRMFEVSHVQQFSPFGQALVVESCSLVSRVEFPETVHWKFQSDDRIDSAAAGTDGAVALTFEDHRLRIYDNAGKQIGEYRSKEAESLDVVAGADGWITCARSSRTMRGHEMNGNLLWSIAIPWHPWQTRRLGANYLVTGVDGECLLVDSEGTIKERNDEKRENVRYFVRKTGKPARAYLSGSSLSVASLGGDLLWRCSLEDRVGPWTVGAAGFWILLGKQLTFFPFVEVSLDDDDTSGAGS